jgi:hypothetical protein
LDIARKPRQFAAEWSTGRRAALNPLGFLATSLAIIGVIDQVVGAIAHKPNNDGPLWAQFLGFVAPYAYYALVGTMAHALLHLWGSRRPLRGSIAIGLYVGGGPLLATEIVTLVAVAIAASRGYWHNGSFAAAPLWFQVPLSAWYYGTFIAVQIIFLRALAGLHDRAPSRCLTALLLALVLVGILAGALHRSHLPLGIGVPHLAIFVRPHFSCTVWF